MRDALGTKIHEGSLIYWKKHDMVYQIVKIDDPADKRIAIAGRNENDTNQAREIKVVLMIQVPIVALPKQEGAVEQWVCVIDPAQQAAIEDALDAGTNKVGRPQ